MEHIGKGRALALVCVGERERGDGRRTESVRRKGKQLEKGREAIARSSHITRHAGKGWRLGAVERFPLKTCDVKQV